MEKAKDHFLQGGKIRMKYTIVPIVFKSLALVQRLHKNKQNDEEWEKKVKTVCCHLHFFPFRCLSKFRFSNFRTIWSKA